MWGIFPKLTSCHAVGDQIHWYFVAPFYIATVIINLSRKIWSRGKNGPRTSKKCPRTKLALQNLVHVGKFCPLVY